MKSGPIQPKEGEFNFTLADQFVDFGIQNNKFITGHCLVWHSQAPRWFFTDSQGNQVSPEVLTQRMKTHIYTVVGRYKGKIKGVKIDEFGKELIITVNKDDDFFGLRL